MLLGPAIFICLTVGRRGIILGTQVHLLLCPELGGLSVLVPLLAGRKEVSHLLPFPEWSVWLCGPVHTAVLRDNQP